MYYQIEIKILNLPIFLFGSQGGCLSSGIGSGSITSHNGKQDVYIGIHIWHCHVIDDELLILKPVGLHHHVGD